MLNGLILIGGKSSRMGTEKYKISFNGKAQYQHLADLLSALKIPVYISCNDQQQKEIPGQFDTITDRYASIGPMGGIVSAMHQSPASAWLVIACDLPFVSRKNIEMLLKNRKPQADVTSFQVDERFFETTFSIYESSAFQWLDCYRKEGNYRLQAVFREMEKMIVKPDNPLEFMNINTPEELLAFRKLNR